MSIRSKFVAAAAALMLVSSVGAPSVPTANAATASCGASCIDLSSGSYGPGFVLDVQDQSEAVGQPIIMAQASNSNPGEDFKISFQGLVQDLFAAGLVSAAVNLHYSTLPAYEFEYSPFGVDSGLCMGVSATPSSGTGITLQPCGVSAKTVWITQGPIDSSDSFLINGADTNFSYPFVLTAAPTGLPLFTSNLTSFFNGVGPPGRDHRAHPAMAW